MKQQCKCGNRVEGKLVATFARKLTRKAVGKGSARLIGSAVGTVLGGPVGTVAGLTIGTLLDDQIKKVSDSVENVIFDNDAAEYEFCCPNCGRKWKETPTVDGTNLGNEHNDSVSSSLDPSNSIRTNLGNEHNDSEEEGQEAFGKLFNWCAENTEQAYNNFEELEAVCTDQMMETSSNLVRSEYYYLLAWIKLEGLIENCFLDETGESIDVANIEKGQRYIRLAIEIFGEDNEYGLIRSMYDLWNCGYNDGWLQISEFDREDVEAYENTLLKNGYLANLWERAAYHYIVNQFEIVGDYDEDDGEDATIWFERANELENFFSWVEEISEPDIDSIDYKLWCFAVKELCLHYAWGEGCTKDLAKTHELAERTAKTGSYRNLFQLADWYGGGYDGFEPNVSIAKSLLRRILNEFSPESDFYKIVQKRLNEISSSTSYSTSSSTNSILETLLDNGEQEYINTLKEILADGEITGRERRLLEKLCVKLGLTEERAAELEASLTAPQLSEEEQEYLNEYREIIADGEISPRERKLLDKIRRMNGISEDRAKELEAMA